MAELHFHSPSGYEKHICESYRKDDWIIYTCPKCDYELRENWRTGKLIVRNPKLKIKHTGSYFPVEFKESFENLN